MSNKRLIGVCQIYLLCAAACCGPIFLAKFANFAIFCIELQKWGGWIGGYQVHLVNCFCTASTKGRNWINLSYNLSLVCWWHQYPLQYQNNWSMHLAEENFFKILPDTLHCWTSSRRLVSLSCLLYFTTWSWCRSFIFHILCWSCLLCFIFCLGLVFYVSQLFSLLDLSFTLQPVICSVISNQI